MTLPAEEYQRPELTKVEKQQANDYAKTMLLKHGMSKLIVLVALFAEENMLLLKEVNHLRSELGIEPLPVHKG